MRNYGGILLGIGGLALLGFLYYLDYLLFEALVHSSALGAVIGYASLFIVWTSILVPLTVLIGGGSLVAIAD